MAAARRMFLALAALLLPHSVSAAALQGIRARGAKASALAASTSAALRASLAIATAIATRGEQQQPEAQAQ
eukprot:CAMPEP_0204042590 /NCGR_PEP_ID=MMETSP0360-20130528/98659_1 /ASSEMBLY_ACC=CAM_ASM_000342 /TAXON_ID=268821 /ORGANISM="Scrippsiella Hangoei, Strain SHTV-5" /LENGTH=70 /DNA_ID=CAMNT_0050988867 /DNA_START=46 /DNA_END=256 /DNA_ORIENTATION=+